MAGYQHLKKRLDRGEVLILDGAIGTELQAMGVPMHPIAWCGEAPYTQPYAVRQMHERYIRAGADIISTDTFSTLRHVLEASGYGNMVREINIRSVYLVQEARDRAAGGRPVSIAGVISNFGVGRSDSTGALWGGSANGYELRPDQAAAYYDELSDILAEAGVDFFLLENLSNQEHRILALRAAKATGLPVWVGFGGVYTAPREYDEAGRTDYVVADQDRDDDDGSLRLWDVKYPDLTLENALDEVLAEGGVDGLTVLHTPIPTQSRAIACVAKSFDGPVACYPDAGRADYVVPHQNQTVPNQYDVDSFVAEAKKWVDLGARVIGGCCGYGLDYIRPLRDALPSKGTVIS